MIKSILSCIIAIFMGAHCHIGAASLPPGPKQIYDPSAIGGKPKNSHGGENVQTVAAGDENMYVNLMGVADSAISKGDWEFAEATLYKAMHLEPANPANLLLLSNIGMLQFYQGKDSLALATLTDAVNIAPTVVSVRQNRANVLEALGRSDEALADCNAILKTDSANVRARTFRLTYAMRAGNLQEATAELDTLKILAPENTLTLVAEASLLTASKRYAEAIGPLTKVIDRDPQPEYYANRAFCRIMTGNLNDASADINDGIALNPLEGELFLYRAMLNKMRYRAEDADEDAKRAISLGISRKRALPYMKK